VFQAGGRAKIDEHGIMEEGVDFPFLQLVREMDVMMNRDSWGH